MKKIGIRLLIVLGIFVLISGGILFTQASNPALARQEWVPCSKCGGSGQQACMRCNGNGQERCGMCGGSGQMSVTCPSCRGTGRDSTKETCSECNGSGRIQEPCQRCGGTGGYPCTRCGGTGAETCSMCGGEGGKYWNYPD